MGLGPNDNVSFQYRADGMRTAKWRTTLSSSEETMFFYDGQMGVQDTWTDGTDTVVTKYGVGARGIDVITKKVNSGSEAFGYPVYDTHGNMVATLARSGSNSYSVGNVQWYDVWGGVRSGSSTEDQGYVANLGHRRDGESGLTYMRARYYEPGTGRFISEDRAMDGRNWYSYCDNSPTTKVDPSGNRVDDPWMRVGLSIAIGITIAHYLDAIVRAFTSVTPVARIMATASLAFMLAFYPGNLTAERGRTADAGTKIAFFVFYGASNQLLASFLVAGIFRPDDYAPFADQLLAIKIHMLTIVMILEFEELFGG